MEVLPQAEPVLVGVQQLLRGLWPIEGDVDDSLGGCVPHAGEGELLGDGVCPLVPVSEALELIPPGLEILPREVVEVPNPGGVGFGRVGSAGSWARISVKMTQWDKFRMTKWSNGHVIRGGSPYSLPEFL